MRYAIGEIVLVVIGILIALQINTWNEDLKDYERIVSGYFRGPIYQQFLPKNSADVSQNKYLIFDLNEMSNNSDLISRIRDIAYFTKMEININGYGFIPLCDSIISLIDTELEKK